MRELGKSAHSQPEELTSLNKDCAVLVLSCDAYSDILDNFFLLFKKYWKNCPFKVYLSTETTDYPNSLVTNLHPKSPNCSWTQRVYDCLEQIEEKYVLICLDDFFFYGKVNTDEIINNISWLKADKDIATFTYWPVYSKTLPSKYPGYQRRLYGNNKVAGIIGLWRKKKLKKYLSGLSMSAWEWEYKGTELSNTLYKKDKFYIIDGEVPYVFQYDFSKYGLFSGKWLDGTKELFKSLGIKQDFSSRGFYNPVLRSRQNSIRNLFVFNSRLLPCFNLRNKTSAYIYTDKKIKDGAFNQTYFINGKITAAKWEPSTFTGFQISNLVISLIMPDGTKEVIDNTTLFGEFMKVEGDYIFNGNAPFVCIPIDTKYVKEISISGMLRYPISENDLQKAYLSRTEPKDNYLYLKERIYNEDITTEEKSNHIKLISTLQSSSQTSLTFNKTILSGDSADYEHSFDLSTSSYGNKLTYTVANYPFFALRDLKIILHYKEKQTSCPKSQLIGLPKKRGKYYVFTDKNSFQIKFDNKKPDKIIIKASFVCPIPPHILRKALTRKKAFSIKTILELVKSKLLH